MAYVYQMQPGNRIRELRKRAKLTQIELGELAGVSQAAISQVENDERPLTVDWMRTFARIFACAPADLLTEKDNPDRLTAEERQLIQQYRAADVPQRQMIERVAEPLKGFQHFDNDKAA